MKGVIRKYSKVIFISMLILLLTMTGASCLGVTISKEGSEDISITFNKESPLVNKSTATAPKSEPEEVEGAGMVLLELTYPVGPSPKVFTTGWIFGAKCIINERKPGKKDISDQVRWSGSGTFQPSTGKTSRPAFNKDGDNTIVLSVDVGDKTITRQYAIATISPDTFAYVGCQAYCPADSHGAPTDPMPAIGRIINGCPDVLVNGKPAVCVGEKGTQCCCSGPNTFEVVEGNPEVLIYGKAAAEMGDATRHCGGNGHIVDPDFIIIHGSSVLQATQFILGCKIENWGINPDKAIWDPSPTSKYVPDYEWSISITSMDPATKKKTTTSQKYQSNEAFFTPPANWTGISAQFSVIVTEATSGKWAGGAQLASISIGRDTSKGQATGYSENFYDQRNALIYNKQFMADLGTIVTAPNGVKVDRESYFPPDTKETLVVDCYAR